LERVEVASFFFTFGNPLWRVPSFFLFFFFFLLGVLFTASSSGENLLGFSATLSLPVNLQVSLVWLISDGLNYPFFADREFLCRLDFFAFCFVFFWVFLPVLGFVFGVFFVLPPFVHLCSPPVTKDGAALGSPWREVSS